MKKLIFMAMLALAGCSDASVSTDNVVGTLPQGTPKVEVSQPITMPDGQRMYTIFDKQAGTKCTVIYLDTVSISDKRPNVSCVFIGEYPEATSWEEYGNAKEN